MAEEQKKEWLPKYDSSTVLNVAKVAQEYIKRRGASLADNSDYTRLTNLFKDWCKLEFFCQIQDFKEFAKTNKNQNIRNPEELEKEIKGLDSKCKTMYDSLKEATDNDIKEHEKLWDNLVKEFSGGEEADYDEYSDEDSGNSDTELENPEEKEPEEKQNSSAEKKPAPAKKEILVTDGTPGKVVTGVDEQISDTQRALDRIVGRRDEGDPQEDTKNNGGGNSGSNRSSDNGSGQKRQRARNVNSITSIGE